MSEHGESKGPQLDLSDVDHRVGQLIGGGQLSEPCNKTDIRRWVMAMDYVNPLHWDAHFARNTKFGDVIAPQSMAVALRNLPVTLGDFIRVNGNPRPLTSIRTCRYSGHCATRPGS